MGKTGNLGPRRGVLKVKEAEALAYARTGDRQNHA